MKILYVCLMAFGAVFFFNTCQAQSTVSGTVRNADQQPLIGATVSAYDVAQNRLTQTATTAGGQFKITITNKTAYLLIGHVGYIPYRITELKKDSLAAILKPQSSQLNEVVIRSQKPVIEQQFDRMVVNVDGSPKAGMNAADILRKIPGVILINNSEYRLEGKGVTVQIDGKPTRLSAGDLQTLLNSTNSAGISQVEVLYNPSAKFDAQGDGGIINIKTLKRVKPGYDASISITAGHGWKYFSNNDLSAALNYRQGDNYLFGSYSYSLGKQSQEIQKNTYLDATGQRLRDSIVYQSPYYSQNMRLGWDHYLNKKDVFGLLLTAYTNESDPLTRSHTAIAQLLAAGTDSTRYADNRNPRHSKGINLNMNYKATLDSARQQELSMDADAGVFDYQNENELSLILKDQQGKALSPVQQLAQAGRAFSHIYSYKLDYSQKIYKGNLEAGIKAGYVAVDNNFISKSGLAGKPLDDNGSNDFNYRETVLAGYFSTKQVFGKFTVLAGLRAEQTYTKGNSLTIDSVVDRNYLSLFPNVTAGYKFKKSTLTLAYSRRIGRPAYNYLNPFRIYRSAYSINQGNPYLQPSFTNNFRLGISLNTKLSFSATYSNTQNVITDLQLLDENTKIATSLKANLSQNYNTGLNAGYYNKLFNILDVSYSIGSSYSIYQFNYQQAPIQIKQLTAYTSLDHRFSLLKTWWVGVFFYGQTRVTYGNQVNLPFCNTNISGGRQILKGRANLSFTANDVFFTGITRSEANYGNVRNDLRSQYDSRNFRLNFSYNFGNAKIEVRKRSSGSADEQRRNQ